MMDAGRVWKFGDDVDTDAIIPATYLAAADLPHLAQHCMEIIAPDFYRLVRPGDILVAGENFGCGSSREHAPLAIKACGIGAVIARSFARIFFRNSVNIGLVVIEHPVLPVLVREGECLQIDYHGGNVTRLSTGVRYPIAACPDFIKGIIDAGGLINYYLTRVANNRS